MTIDLMSLAKKADETYLDVECSFGSVRVYHVPDAVLLAGPSIFSEPELPTVSMKTVTGTQERAAKKGDAVYDEWYNEVASIREKQFELRQAKGFVMALRDIDWAAVDLTGPPPNKIAQEMFNSSWPSNDILRKKAWLDFTVLAQRDDKELILDAINRMNQVYEPTEEMVESVKKNSASSSGESQED